MRRWISGGRSMRVRPVLSSSGLALSFRAGVPGMRRRRRCIAGGGIRNGAKSRAEKLVGGSFLRKNGNR